MSVVATALLSLLFLGVSRSQPTFPDGVAQILKSINDRQSSYDRPQTDQSGKLAKLAHSGGAHIQEDLVEAISKEELAKVRVHASMPLLMPHIPVMVFQGGIRQSASANAQSDICRRLSTRYDVVS